MPAKGKFSQRLRDLTEKLNYRQLLFLAFLVSCLLGVFVYVSLSSIGLGDKPEPQVATQPVNTKKVVVANGDIPQRAIIKESMLKIVEVPDSMVPSGAVDDIKKFINLPASVFIQKGDVLTSQKVYTDPKMAGFPGIIPADCRAFSIGISDVTGVAGFARPGDFVDVMLVKNKSSNGRLSGEIILQNVMLLGINKSANPPRTAAPVDEQGQDGGKSGGDKKKDNKGAQNNGSVQASEESMATATMALTPEESLKLAVAMQEGSIYLTLRPLHPKDMFVLKTDYSIISNDTPAPAAPQPQVSAPSVRSNEPAAAPASAPAPAPAYESSIEVIRGVNSSVVGVND